MVEMIAAMAIAIIVSLAAFSLIEVVMKRTGEVGARVETTQRARGALDDMTRELRSQVCVIRSDPSFMTSARTIYSATATDVVFFADTADESFKTASDTIPVPTLRTLTFTPAANARGTITETIRPGVKDTTKPGIDAVSFSSTTSDRTRTALTNIEQMVDPVTNLPIPVFRYFTYDLTKSPPTATKEITPGTNATALESVAKIAITYRVRAVGKVTQRVWTSLQNETLVRTVDPNTSNPKPTCP
jgi:hypothetical protein